ncbi:MAG TPA: GNAT family N-acetyltransferase [Candidatus Polarisedimenticolia bacterium]|nr:GNAT family N-acetyltransferase [Candidatus Polarisedimenticolia bacterium]
MTIRIAADADRGGILECMDALQNYERSVEPDRADPEDVVEPYVNDLLAKRHNGTVEILVAEIDTRVVGWIGVVAQYTSEDILERHRKFAYITDLIVLEACRGRGVGRRLLEAAEAYAASKGARRLKVGVLAANGAAHRVYAAAGFRDYEVILAKEIGVDKGKERSS